MLPYGIILALCLAGYAGLPWWSVLPGAAALTLYGWWAKLWWLAEPPRGHWSKKITAYFVTGIVADFIFAVVSFGVGRAARVLLG